MSKAVENQCQDRRQIARAAHAHDAMQCACAVDPIIGDCHCITLYT